MTRRDYVLLSSALGGAALGASPSLRPGIELACTAVAAALKKANPGGFDYLRFMEDCGYHIAPPVHSITDSIDVEQPL